MQSWSQPAELAKNITLLSNSTADPRVKTHLLENSDWPYPSNLLVNCSSFSFVNNLLQFVIWFVGRPWTISLTYGKEIIFDSSIFELLLLFLKEPLLEKIELRARDFLNKACQPKFITSPDWLCRGFCFPSTALSHIPNSYGSFAESSCNELSISHNV